MPNVICPSCHEKGRIPDTFIGHGIKCGKCGNRFQVTAPSAKVVTPTPVTVRSSSAAAAADGIVVEGLEEVSWTATATHPEEHAHAHDHDPGTAVFTATHAEPHPDGVKEYKVLTQKDKFFEGKFEFTKLEAAINHYARQGWVVRSMATPQVMGFSGGSKEEIVVLLER